MQQQKLRARRRAGSPTASRTARARAPALSPESILQRLPELRLRLDSDDSVRIEHDGRVLHCRSHALAVLDAFSAPSSLGETVAKLRGRVAGAHDWAELMETIVALHAAGVLSDPAVPSRELGRAQAGLEAPLSHLALLDDRGRTESLLEGIRASVRPGDVVLDMGTGTGVLALAAARAGAARVYAIESGGIASVAKRLFQANGMGDRITLVEGWSTRVQLPERADVLVSEIIGNEPFAEWVLEFFADAQRRLLKPAARVVPRRLCVYATPVAIPAGEVGRRAPTPEAAARWRRWYGLEFSPLVAAARRRAMPFYAHPWQARRWRPFAEPTLLADVAFDRPLRQLLSVRRRARSLRAGAVAAVLMHFDLDTGGATVSTEPVRARRDCSWLNPVWLLPAPLAVRRGSGILIDYSRGGDVGRIACRLQA